MVNMFRKIIAIILVCCLLLSSTSCFAPSYSSENSGWQENTLHEEVLFEQIKKEDVLKEEKLEEYILKEIRLFEESLPENVVIEDVQVEIVLSEDLEDYFDSCCTSDIMMYDIDWGKIIGKFAVGTAVIIITAVLSVTTSTIPGVGVVFATSCKEALKESIFGAAAGAAAGALIGAIQSGGKVTAMQKFAIEGAADGFMWGAISGALIGAYKGHSNYKNPNIVYLDNQKIGTIEGLDIIDDFGNIKGQITPNGFAVDISGNVLGKLDDAGNLLETYKSLIPPNGKILGSSGKVKYSVTATKQILDKAGDTVGTINEAGQIVNSSGLLVGMIDDSGRLISGLQKTINSGFKVNLSGRIVNTTKVIQGVVYYLDDAGEVVGSVRQVTNGMGTSVSYVMKTIKKNSVKVVGPVPESGLSKVVGQVDDTGSLIVNWEKYFKVERNKGVKIAWAQERTLVETTGLGTHNWTDEEMIELRETGKVKGYQGHHINSALYSPHLAANPNNIKFYNAAEHLSIGHDGNFQNVTFGNLINRLKE